MRKCLYRLATDEYKGFVFILPKLILLLLSYLYSLLVRRLIIRGRFKLQHFNAKIISVGNITVGGTGKTPLVEYIVRFLTAQGHKVAVVSRGYKGYNPEFKAKSVKLKTSGRQPQVVGKVADEPVMLAGKLPGVAVIVDKDRPKGIKLAIAQYAVDTVVLDDGFQQWAIKKDLEVVVIDSTNPFGNGHLLPRGILRQPLSGLASADVCICSKVTTFGPAAKDVSKILRSVNSPAEVFQSKHQPVGFWKLESLTCHCQEGEARRSNRSPEIASSPAAPRNDKGQKLLDKEVFSAKSALLLSGIADPDYFEQTVQSLGVAVSGHWKFADHHRYSRLDFERIANRLPQSKAQALITTEKDAARIPALLLEGFPLPVYVLRIELQVDNEQRFRDRLLSLYSG